MKGKYAIIIVGAGPGGLECANQLKNSSLSVLLIEKNSTIGPKTCAGGLTKLDAKFDIPLDKTRSFTEQEVIITNKSHNISLRNALKTISRFDLGQHQLSKIERFSNIRILKETLVKKIEKDKIITDKGIFRFKYLVGADGSNSIVRKYLGLNSKICIGMYYDIQKITDRFIWYVNPKQLKSGYIWVFPHKSCTNIGVYFNPEYIDAKCAKHELENYLLNNNYDFSKSELKAAPINYFYQGCVFNNFFLVGDAAGLASKTTGEGISFALISGKEIAKKILDSDYNMTELDHVLMYKKRQERMLNLFERFPLFQSLFIKLFVSLMGKKRFQSYFGI